MSAAPRRSRAPVEVLAVLAIASAFALNEWTIPALLDRDPASLKARSVLSIRTAQGLAAAAGLAALVRHLWMPLVAGLPRCTVARWTRARVDPRLFLALVPLAVLDAQFWVLGCLRDRVDLVSALAVLSLANKLVLDGLHALALGLLVRLVLRSRVAAASTALLFGAAVMADSYLMWFGHTRFEHEHLELVAGIGLGGYVTPRTTLFGLVGLALCIWSGALLARALEAARWSTLAVLAAAAALLHVVRLPVAYRDLSDSYRGPLERDVADTQLARLTYLERGSLVHIATELAAPPPRVACIDDVGPFDALIDELSLGLGRPPTTRLDARPFRRVVLVVVESLSLDFSRFHNPALPATLTPFLDSERARASAFRGHRANSQPTLPGLIATLMSHPNPAVAQQRVHTPALPQILAHHGWRTIMVRSDPERFGGSDLVLASMGFQRQLGRTYFLHSSGRARFVSGWGACDRIVYEEALELLDHSRDEPTFLTVLTCDTHTPHGRTDYHGLEYAEAPAWIRAFPELGRLLESVHRADQDLERFLSALGERGLFDEETLVVVTADHSCPIMVELERLPGLRPESLGAIPLVLLTPRELPPCDLYRPTSQLDVAPSLLHLLGYDVPAGMWGRSVFETGRPAPEFIGWFRERLTVGSGEHAREFRLESPSSTQDALLARLFCGWVR